MSTTFFERPILNSPYRYPARHWELDVDGQPTQRIMEGRRRAEFVTPIPRSKKVKRPKGQVEMDLGPVEGLNSDQQRYELATTINEIRAQLDIWRGLQPGQWRVTPVTQRLLTHWRTHDFGGVRPFFCQVEAVETIIWLTEVAPHTAAGRTLLERLARANKEANRDLPRLALKLATGAGKTTVMAMVIAWQTLNAVQKPGSKLYTRGFLIVAPGITIRDRLRVLQPNDPESYYGHREIVPTDMLADMQKARIVITNFHAFKLRERVQISKGTRDLLKGKTGEAVQTLESEGQMLQRVVPDLMGIKGVMVLNDEAHHCYRAKEADPEEDDLKGEERKEADENREAARLWMSGLEALHRKVGLQRVVDLSATPFFLSGSGYAEGTLFPWVMSDFSLMDAIECGIVKLPRVPVADNIPGAEMPIFRDLWKHVGPDLPKAGKGKAGDLDPLKLPTRLVTALEALYGHYEKTFHLWEEHKLPVPPCFIVVCQNTSISKLVFDYISGFQRKQVDGSTTLENGRLGLFRNYDGQGNPLPRPHTLLIDSQQLEAGDALDPKFREMATDEIERFRRAIVERTGNAQAAADLTEQDLLREVMNTVGKAGQLGAGIRCVVSVSMLTEGWDANNVTHILGIRAFGTQLLCEQVIGRALRRQSYDLNEEGLFNAEYADIFGVPFDFTAKPVVSPPQTPRETITVKAIRPERDHLEIRFPRIEGYRVQLPREQLKARFTADSTLELTPDLVGPTITRNSGIIGETADMTLAHLDQVREATLLYTLTKHLLYNHWRDAGEDPKLHLFGELKRIAQEWLDHHLVCKGGTFPAQLLYTELAAMACERITAGITAAHEGENMVVAIPDSYNPIGSTAYVRFTTSKVDRWDTSGPPPKCHLNWAMLDSPWEAEFCRAAEAHPRVVAYVKNHNLGFEVPYRLGGVPRHYRPDFILLVDDGHGSDDLLRLVVETKGYRREDAKEKKLTMETKWVPGVNNLKSFGRWAFLELTDLYTIEANFSGFVEREFEKMMETVTTSTGVRLQ